MVVAALIGIGVAFLYLIDRSLLNVIINKMSLTFNPTGISLKIGEVGGLSLSTAWEYFGACFYISLVALVMILYLVIKEGGADKTLLLVWSLVTLIAAFGQERLAYYLAVNVALLTTYLSWRLLEFAGFREASEEVTGAELDRSATLQTEVEKPRLTKKAKRRTEKASKRRQEAPSARILNARYVYSLIALIVVFFLVFYPNIGKAINWANAFRGPFQYWHEALVWMEDNTPEPFSEPDFYYDLYEKPARGGRYDYPESAYGVMSWWDFGYWITYIAHRIPNANPSGYGARVAGLFFTAQDESSANEIMDSRGSKYVIIDYLMAMPEVSRQSQTTGYFPAMIEWAGKDQSEFFEEYYAWNNGELQRVLLYYPAFYQSMCTRLFAFGGEEVIPDNSTWIVSYIERIDENGFKYKEITSDQLRFPTYEAAEEYLRTHSSDNYRIVGNDPFDSPVPLEGLDHYKLVYESPTYELASKLSAQFEPLETRHVPHIKIFEYLP
jgi:dolichyl-diphosphooligosaccharide--protein glycosyltransferase